MTEPLPGRDEALPSVEHDRHGPQTAKTHCWRRRRIGTRSRDAEDLHRIRMRRATCQMTESDALDMRFSRPLSTGRGSGIALDATRELMFVLLVAVVYFGGRIVAKGQESMAMAHALALHRWEQRWLLVPNEIHLQRWLIDNPSVAQIANGYYGLVHFPITIGTLVWLYANRRSIYRITRTVLTLVTIAGIGLAFMFPLAPPRLLTDSGFIDVAARFGQSVYGEPGTDAANQFAAMPSLHVGWAIVIAFALVAASRSPIRWLWLLHPLVTTLVVVGTANHYWSDGIIAAILVVLALPVATRVDRRHRQRPVWTEHL